MFVTTIELVVLQVSKGIHPQCESKLVSIGIVCLNVLLVGLPDSVSAKFFIIILVGLAISLYKCDGSVQA